jgi:hypothetical protein
MDFVKPRSGIRLLLTTRNLWIGLLLTALTIGLITSLAPIERTLGDNARLVYFHGAWVWTGKLAFGAAALAGLVGMIRQSSPWARISLALGRTGLFFWLTYLPLSLYVQQVNWGGIFWDEPRWRIPLMFGVAGLLLQAGLALMEDPRLACAANLIFGAALWWFLGNAQNVLHPDSPIFQSNAVDIQVFFVALLALSIVFGGLLGYLLYRLSARQAS